VSTPDVRSFTVGPVQENCFIVRPHEGATKALIVDPGDEPQRLLDAIEALGVEIEAILLTHCHFDHIGAVAPLAAATGAPVYCPKIERPLLADIMSFVPPGFGPFESYEPEHLLSGGEHLSLAGLEIDVLFTRRRGSCSRVTSCFRVPSAGWISRAAIGRRSSARSVSCSPPIRPTRSSIRATWASRRSAGSSRRTRS
jgi:hypothetical protein